jgi:hypothetical protein
MRGWRRLWSTRAQSEVFPLDFEPILRVLAVRRRAWGPPFAHPPLMSYTFFTEALNEICDSI